ncbi:hypothetical protein FAZ19_22255 [Sphingobacterium alkalisoli]|uniref:Histidine kinase N-terminal 7TM region domain-containing protein n=1 Tax=Sphingobacterium alkalisoli TaxID=1874115 RepID=A0A4U0GSA9_9SPHI|nr:hypothetical protein [Sphingobacterium alkalisoli]TJY61344.1 hypothetical protein FAZ19_22255 [Sphingobacterium alkalisoli]GGH30831.1 hypothetical protein GCM10011418_43200 [Sphingobacterium alkalisoli]
MNDITYVLGLYFAGLGLLLSLAGILLRFYYKHLRTDRAEQLICIAVGVMMWHIIIYIMILNGHIKQWPNLYNKGIPIYYLIAPCTYYYTLLKLYPKARISRLWYLHLLPFAFGLIDIMPYAVASTEEKVALLELVTTDLQMGFKHSYGFIDQKWHYIVKFLLAFVYLMAQWRLIYIFEPSETHDAAQKRSVIGFSGMYSLHLFLQGSMILNVLFNQLQGSFILRDINQIVWVSLFFMFFSVWVFYSALPRRSANRQIRRFANRQI